MYIYCFISTISLVIDCFLCHNSTYGKFHLNVVNLSLRMCSIPEDGKLKFRNTSVNIVCDIKIGLCSTEFVVAIREVIDHQGSVQQQSDTTTVIPEVLS